MVDPENYLGAKSGSGVYQAIINVMPPHDTYIETHLGSGAIMRFKAPAQRNIGIDIDPQVIESAMQRLSFINAELYSVDAKCFIESNADWFTDRTLIYCDPPYMHETRTSSARYRFEYSEKHHRQLLQTLLSIGRKAKIIISGYRSVLYDTMLADWRALDFQAMTRGGVRTETIWFNYDLGAVHWHKYAGKDYTDRQRIKRKCERWAKRFQNLPQAEKQAVLSALLAVPFKGDRA